jgi:hypothetical protein
MWERRVARGDYATDVKIFRPRLTGLTKVNSVDFTLSPSEETNYLRTQHPLLSHVRTR